jgi:hypothetical protein
MLEIDWSRTFIADLHVEVVRHHGRDGRKGQGDDVGDGVSDVILEHLGIEVGGEVGGGVDEVDRMARARLL